MNTFYASRKKTWGLRATIKPQESFALSGVAHILDSNGPGYCYIKFNWSFVEDMGQAMPRGIGDHDRAYLQAIGMHDELWVIYCCYLEGGHRRAVWTENGLPPWIRSIKRKGDGEQDRSQARSG